MKNRASFKVIGMQTSSKKKIRFDKIYLSFQLCKGKETTCLFVLFASNALIMTAKCLVWNNGQFQMTFMFMGKIQNEKK